MPAKETKPAPPKNTGKPAAKAPLKKGAAAKKPAAAAKGAVAKKGGKKAEPAKEHKGNYFKALYTPKPKPPRGIGNPYHARDLSRYVKWPRYIRIQRQRKILYNRLKVPPAINQFTRTLDTNATNSLFKLAMKYRPEEHQAKRKRLVEIAKANVKGQALPDNLKKPLSVVSGANQVVKAIEAKQAKLVVIPHDVDPIELVIAIPTLCRKLDIPYVIVKSKARLGDVVRRKWTAALAFVDVNKADKQDLANLATIARESFNENTEHRRQWGGGKLGNKSAAKIAKKHRILAKEQAAREKASAAKAAAAASKE